jgi:hypothetical protein
MARGAEHLLRSRGAIQHRQSARRRRGAGDRLTYKLSKNLQVDAGVRFGMTDAADRFSPFFGVSARY